MKYFFCCGLLCVFAAGCAGVTDKVMQDFGVQDRPEDYVSGADRVMERLNDVGKAELNRMNAENRAGRIEFDESDELHGKFYKVLKRYERHYPLDANATGRTSGNRERGFVGYVEYSYSYYEGPRKNTRVEAGDAVADIPTRDDGRETYRYRFNSAGAWNGTRGELVR